MIFVISRKWPFREPEVGLKWPLGEELGVEVNGVCQGTGGDEGLRWHHLYMILPNPGLAFV